MNVFTFGVGDKCRSNARLLAKVVTCTFLSARE